MNEHDAAGTANARLLLTLLCWLAAAFVATSATEATASAVPASTTVAYTYDVPSNTSQARLVSGRAGNLARASSSAMLARSAGDLSAHRVFVATETAGGVGKAGISFGPAPENAWSTLERVEAKGSPLPGYKGGSTFANDGRAGSQILPRTTSGGDAITYREWDVNPYVKGVDRGPERVVTGSDGAAYYTNNHYETFTQFWGPGG